MIIPTSGLAGEMDGLITGFPECLLKKRPHILPEKAALAKKFYKFLPFIDASGIDCLLFKNGREIRHTAKHAEP
jgi:hypothetical protein